MNSLALAELPLSVPVVGKERLAKRVWRLHLDTSAPMRTLIAKCLTPEVSKRVEMVIRRWLPAVGLASAAPPLWRVVRAPSGGMMWHLYEDLGDWVLEESGDDEERLRALVALLALLHTSFASHTLLSEIRQHAGDLGAPVHTSAQKDVVLALAEVRPESSEQGMLRDRLSARFEDFLEEAPARVAMLRELGGPDTLVHGDMWPQNGVVVPSPSGPHAHLVDWDHIGAGNGIYDLTTLLSRLPAKVRGLVLRWYRDEAGPLAAALTSRDDLNRLGETCERTRLALWCLSRIQEIDSQYSDWAWASLAEAEAWLDVPPLFPQRADTQ